MNGSTPEIRNQMKKDEPLLRPTMPPASANENAMTRYATAPLQALHGPENRPDRGDDERDREQHRDEAEDGRDRQLDGQHSDREDDDPRDDPLAEPRGRVLHGVWKRTAAP